SRWPRPGAVASEMVAAETEFIPTLRSSDLKTGLKNEPVNCGEMIPNHELRGTIYKSGTAKHEIHRLFFPETDGAARGPWRRGWSLPERDSVQRNTQKPARTMTARDP